jgi:hypothetical protein
VPLGRKNINFIEGIDEELFCFEKVCFGDHKIIVNTLFSKQQFSKKTII